ncbi:ABC transporter substrate-binding protein [Blautia glucerasea]|uniref:ABC transporter substrate-binding protein n=1 Tax=Blautia glucerasea TaxID=536633 RepID=UPI0015709DF6|nr:extracellular solute-binding protein [Blautia glucerasea]NSJ26382.1 extracellular solute-binding protein [Blautia glucerasea]
MKKFRLLTATVVCTAMLTAGLTSVCASAEEKTVVTVWVNGGEDAYVPVVKDAFEKAHPEIELDLLLVPQEESFQKIMTTISTGGELPDIVDVNLDNLGQVLDLDLWEDLSSDPYNFDESLLMPYMTEALHNAEGKLVALQGDLTTCAVAYDRNLAKEYLGTDDPDELSEMLKSTQDYIDIGKEITEKSDGTVYTFASAQDAWGMLYAEMVDKPFVSEGKLDIDDSIGEIYSFIETLVQNGSLDLYDQWSAEWVNNISQSETMFYSCPLWFVHWGLASNDSVGGGRWGVLKPSSGATSGGENYLISKSSDEDKKQAAFTFLSWLCASEEGAKALYDGGGMVTGFAGNLDKDGEFYNIEDEAYAGQDVLGVFLDVAQMDSTRTRPLTKYDSGIFASGTSVLTDLAQGMSAEDALQTVKDDIAGKYPELEID